MPLLASTFAPWMTNDAGVVGFPYLRVRKGIAIIGLFSAVPTGPLMATGRVGAEQLDAFARLLDWDGRTGSGRIVLTTIRHS